MAVSYKVTHSLAIQPSNSTPRCLPKWNKKLSPLRICMHMLKAALLELPNDKTKQKNPKSLGNNPNDLEATNG